ncbi:MAG: AsmA-like C-terminal region-containing protein [Ferruginibacter sp.]
MKGFIVLLIILTVAATTLVIYVSAKKHKIITQVTNMLSQKIAGKVNLGDVELSFIRDFPHVSVLLHDVSVTDSMFPSHHIPLLKSKEIFASLSITKLIVGKADIKRLRVKDGEINLFTDSLGYTNKYLLKPKQVSTSAKGSAGGFTIRKVVLDNVKLHMVDALKGKDHKVLAWHLETEIDKEDGNINFTTEANLLVEGLGFNTSRGSYLTHKSLEGNFNFVYNLTLQKIIFDNVKLKLEQQPFNISASFDTKPLDPQFELKLNTTNADYDLIKTLLPGNIQRSLSIVSLEKYISADANISGPLKGGEPLVNISWRVKDADLKTPFLDFTKASFTGMFTNESQVGLPRNDPNSKIVLNKFGALWRGIPVTMNQISIVNLLTPTLTCDLHAITAIGNLEQLMQSDVLQFKSGKLQLDLTYNGPIERNNNTNSFINGNVQVSDGELLYAPRNVEMKNVNARVDFKNSDVIVQNLQCNVLGHSVTMNGTAQNLLSLLKTDPRKANIAWNISMPFLKLESFLFLLKSKNKKVASTKKKSGILTAGLDDALEEASLVVSLKTARIIYNNFEASNFSGKITLKEDNYLLDNLSMSHAGGSMRLNGSLLKVPQNYYQARINTKIENADVKKVFTSFENFGQDAILASNLEGKLTADINASMFIKDEGKMKASGITGTVDFSLRDGALINYEPVKKMQKFIFKNRDFDNIRFAELKDKLDISNQEIRINRMEIQSTVMSLFVEGLYSRKGNTDISIQVPLSNIKKRDGDMIPENIGVNKKTGTSIFLRGRPGSDGNVQFKLDLFHKYNNDGKKSK